MSNTSFKDQIRVFHGASPELYNFLMDLIQDAQSLGSIVQIVTIIPPFLELNENGERRFKTYSGGCSPNSPRPDAEGQCSPGGVNKWGRDASAEGQCSPGGVNKWRQDASAEGQCSPGGVNKWGKDASAEGQSSPGGPEPVKDALEGQCSPNSPKKD